jgi:hypothetical protein
LDRRHPISWSRTPQWPSLTPVRSSHQWTVNKGAEGNKRFRCLFTPDRQLRDVMATTPDGEWRVPQTAH